jgi:hypothetical protein
VAEVCVFEKLCGDKSPSRHIYTLIQEAQFKHEIKNI